MCSTSTAHGAHHRNKCHCSTSTAHGAHHRNKCVVHPRHMVHITGTNVTVVHPRNMVHITGTNVWYIHGTWCTSQEQMCSTSTAHGAHHRNKCHCSTSTGTAHGAHHRNKCAVHPWCTSQEAGYVIPSRRKKIVWQQLMQRGLTDRGEHTTLYTINLAKRTQ